MLRRDTTLVLLLLAAGVGSCGRSPAGSSARSSPAASAAASPAAAREAGPITVADALSLRDRGQALFVDVRSPEAYAEGHVIGAINVPLAEVSARAEEIRSLHKLPILYCG